MPTRRRCLYSPAAFLLLLAGCGYVGDPLPPLINIPKPVTGLAAVERGDRIIVQFQLPAETTEQAPIKSALVVELRISDTPIVPFEIDRWTRESKPYTGGVLDKRLARYEIPVAGLAGHEITIGARVAGANGKQSDWSEMVSLPVVAPPETPSGVRVEPTPTGVRVSWSGAPGRFRILRRGPDEKTFTLAVKVEQSEWIDPRSEFGKPYAYIVQRVVDLGRGREAESELPAEVSITPKDTFPPAAPSGFRASAALGSIELSWDRSPEADVAGYRIYRAASGAGFDRIAETGETPAYSDRSAAAGVTYRYAVSAFDQAGNEGPRSSPAEAAR
jgi:hypothetical protein